jgi:polyferredoxin
MKISKLQTIRHFIQLFFLLNVVFHFISMPIIILVILGSVIVGGVFCGWVCPFGTIQEFINSIKVKLKIKSFNVNYKLHNIFKWLRYVFWIILFTFSGSIIAQKLDLYNPRSQFFKVINTKEVGNHIAFYLMLFIFFISLFIDRFFCNYMCPMGAKIGLMSLIRPFSIKRNTKTCINCKLCEKKCPMKINVSKIRDMHNPHCIGCLKCVSNCPKKSLSLRPKKIYTFWKK